MVKDFFDLHGQPNMRSPLYQQPPNCECQRDVYQRSGSNINNSKLKEQVDKVLMNSEKSFENRVAALGLKPESFIVSNIQRPAY